MKMNTLEKWAMNNPVRTLFQRYLEAPVLIKRGGLLRGKRVLEIGCGRGVGTQLLLEDFKAQSVLAIDLDEDMILKAKKRLSSYPSDRLEVQVGDLTKLNCSDQSFDAVVNFAAIHHVPNWQKALCEIHRVLKNEGQFFFQEVTAQWIHRFPYSVLFKHPKENRFTGLEFIKELERAGIVVGDNYEERAGGDFIYGVGRRAENENHKNKKEVL